MTWHTRPDTAPRCLVLVNGVRQFMNHGIQHVLCQNRTQKSTYYLCHIRQRSVHIKGMWPVRTGRWCGQQGSHIFFFWTVLLAPFQCEAAQKLHPMSGRCICLCILAPQFQVLKVKVVRHSRCALSCINYGVLAYKLAIFLPSGF